MADHLGEGENYTKVSNEILEALAKAKLNGTQHAICLVVCRYTYGFRRCEAKLSASFISEATDITLRHVKRELQALYDRSILIQKDQRDGVTSTLGFNKDIPNWLPVTKKSPVKPVTNSAPVTNPSLAPVTNSAPEPVTNPSPKKPKKENIKENSYSSDTIQIQLAALLYQKTKEHYPSLKEPDLQGWAKHVDLLLCKDGKDPEEIRKVILWAKADSFWRPNIMSAEKLRKQYDTLNVKRIEGLGRASPIPFNRDKTAQIDRIFDEMEASNHG